MFDRRVLFFGDSFVAGVGDPRGQGWVGRIVETAFAAGQPFTAYNLGVRHETSVQVAARWRAETAPRVLEGAEMRVVFAFGANDTRLENGALRTAIEDSCETLAGALEEAAALSLPVAVAGPPPLGDAANLRRVVELGARFGEVCAGQRVPYLPTAETLIASRTWMDEAAANDGAHPSAGGYDLLAEVLIDAGLLDWLDDPAAIIPRD